MKRSLHDAQGRPVALGRELGRGGEGAVYELPAKPEWVAKLYHRPPDAAKQAKLRLMAESIDSPLRNYAAWPEETLHDAQGAVIGFTMQRIDKRLPIHMLYSPAQRRESFPCARFDFLVFVARNIAAAFETLHAHGHVLGDVNQGNVLVGEDSRVILIDCDSFQIQVGDALHRCEVGVAHFTPSELQSIRSFEDITRTPNHDAFGLALLIFHLLMGGRHPYSGVPLADKVGESLEADIRDYRYAYASDAAQRLIAPPPKSVPIASVSPPVIELFERAFCERGVASRPTAQQWVAALDGLRAQLKSCTKNALHVRVGHAQDCVWCSLERKHVVFFGQLPQPRVEAKATPLQRTLSAAEMEDLVLQWPTPVERKLPPLVELPGTTPTAADMGTSDAAAVLGTGGLWSGMSALTGNAAIAAGVFGVTAVVATALGFRSLQKKRRRQEYAEAVTRFRRLNDDCAAINSEINVACAVQAHQQWRGATKALRQFVAQEPLALAEFKSGATDRGRRQFLQGQRIEQCKDPRLSQLARIRMKSAGIETAMDFDKASLDKLHVLNDSARAAVLEWKLDLVRQFNQPTARQEPELQTFRTQRKRERALLEAKVSDLFKQIQQARQHGSLITTARTNQLQTLLAERAKQHALCLELAQGL